jgi:TolB-like protein/Tfp pilus assembly protein PilF
VLGIGFFAYYKVSSSNVKSIEKSIAVLPFKNDSNDSTNVYLINGLMESMLNNLQQIEDLRVISRTSSEKYRNTTKSIPEISKELDVNYFVEGSGQKIGDKILLNIQLIEASSDRHLWSKQYRREAKDIFALQEEIAKNIADEIEVFISPEVEKRIQKKPTENLVAYDVFLKGRDAFYRNKLLESIPYFKKAIELDNKFALAYAQAAIVYYYLDIFQEEKKYGEEIDDNADKALLYDSRLAESMVAKALSYIHKKEYELAVTYLEKALEYNPNSILVINFLSDIYNIYTPNTAKYLENALKGLRLGMGAYDSSATSFIYLHISNAFIQTGFIDESIRYINKSLDYNPKNPFSGYVKILFSYAKNKDLEKTRIDLAKELNKDTTRIDLQKEMGKLCYTMRDYKSSYRYYKNFVHLREAQQLNIFQNEDLVIGFLYAKMGLEKEAEKFVKSFKAFADGDKSIYHNLHQTLYYLYQHDDLKAIEHLALFSKEENYQYWVLLLTDDPLADHIKNSPEFKRVMTNIESKFWKANREIKKNLEEKGLL